MNRSLTEGAKSAICAVPNVLGPGSQNEGFFNGAAALIAPIVHEHVGTGIHIRRKTALSSACAVARNTHGQSALRSAKGS